MEFIFYCDFCICGYDQIDGEDNVDQQVFVNFEVKERMCNRVIVESYFVSGVFVENCVYVDKKFKLVEVKFKYSFRKIWYFDIEIDIQRRKVEVVCVEIIFDVGKDFFVVFCYVISDSFDNVFEGFS